MAEQVLSRCSQGIECPFNGDDLTAKACQDWLDTNYETIRPEIIEEAPDCPSAMTTVLISRVREAALRSLIEGRVE